MNITLTKVHYCAALSDETNAFDAIVCVDAVPAFRVSNHGTGSCHDYHSLLPTDASLAEHRAWQDKLIAFVSALPRKSAPIPGHPDFTYPQSLDTLVDDAFADWLLEKDVAKYTKRMADRTLALNSKGQLVTMPKTRNLSSQMGWMDSNHPEFLILNKLPLADATKGIRNALRNASGSGQSDPHEGTRTMA